MNLSSYSEVMQRIERRRYRSAFFQGCLVGASTAWLPFLYFFLQWVVS